MNDSSSIPPMQSAVTVAAAHSAGRAHGERAFITMLTPEMFEQYLHAGLGVWRNAGFPSECLRVAESAARAAYRGEPPE